MSTAINDDPESSAQGRRGVLQAMLGIPALSLAAISMVAEPAPADALASFMPSKTLTELTRRLAASPRRRSFSTVPFMVTSPEGWDEAAAMLLLAYPCRRQMWEFSDIAGPSLSLMRESLNCQNFTFKHTDFLAVSATHGLAHLGLFSQAMWDKYALSDLAGAKFPSNTLLPQKPGVQPSDSLEDVQGYYGPGNSNIATLQQRGVVFIACHDSIHAVARAVVAKTSGGASAGMVAADLTNNLAPGAVLVPSVVGFMEELQRNGFTYVKS